MAVRGKASDQSALAAHEDRQHPHPIVDRWRSTTYSARFALSPEAFSELSRNAFNLGNPNYYISHGKRGGLRRRRPKR